MLKSKSIFRLSAIVIVCGASLCAQLKTPEPMDPGNRNQQPKIFEQVGIDPKLGGSIPLEIDFKDEGGRNVKLGDYFNRKRPVVLALVYYDCPMLCNQVLNGMTSALQVLKFNAGQEFDVVAVSFDPRETPELALAKRKTYLDRYKRPGTEIGWHFLTGTKDSIDALTKGVGFRYAWDEKSNQFAHASALTLLTPQGKIAQYYYGIEYSPKDMRLGIIEASDEKVGNITDQLLLYCYHYDPTTGKYGAMIMRMVRLGAILTMVLLGGFIVVSVKKERRTQTAR
jgi:protein SCO1/2